MLHIEKMVTPDDWLFYSINIRNQLIDMVKKPAINMQNFAQHYKPRLRQINSALIKNKIEAMVET